MRTFRLPIIPNPKKSISEPESLPLYIEKPLTVPTNTPNSDKNIEEERGVIIIEIL